MDGEELGCGCVSVLCIIGLVFGFLYLVAKHDNQAIEIAKKNLHDNQYLYQDRYLLNKPDTKYLKQKHYKFKFNGNNVTDNSSNGFNDKTICRNVIYRYLKQFKNRKDYNYSVEIDDNGTTSLIPITTGNTTSYISQYNDAYYGTLIMDKK